MKVAPFFILTNTPSQKNNNGVHLLASSGYPSFVAQWRTKVNFPLVAVSNYSEEETLEYAKFIATPSDDSAAGLKALLPRLGSNPHALSLYRNALRAGHSAGACMSSLRSHYAEKARELLHYTPPNKAEQDSFDRSLFQLFFRGSKPVRPFNPSPILQTSLLLNSEDSEGITFLNALAAEALFQGLQELMSGQSNARHRLLLVLNEMVLTVHKREHVFFADVLDFADQGVFSRVLVRSGDCRLDWDVPVGQRGVPAYL